MDRRTKRALVAAGVAGLATVGGITAADIARIDPTSGGYEPPYTDVVGEPIDWSAHVETETGFRDDRGVLLNTSLDCTTGMIRAHVGPFSFDFRTLSERAIVVHEPHIACLERGFEPEWRYDLDEGPLPGTGDPAGEADGASTDEGATGRPGDARRP